LVQWQRLRLRGLHTVVVIICWCRVDDFFSFYGEFVDLGVRI
jgi:hypothetical protein